MGVYHYKAIVGTRGKPPPTMCPSNTIDTSIVLFETAEFARMNQCYALISALFIIVRMGRNMFISLAPNGLQTPNTNNTTRTRSSRYTLTSCRKTGAIRVDINGENRFTVMKYPTGLYELHDEVLPSIY